MTTITCKRCGADKPAGEMIIRGGKPSQCCRSCFAASFSGKKKSGGGSTVKRASTRVEKPEVVADSAPAPVKLNGHLEVAAGFGFRASIEDGVLQFEQDRQDGDTIYTHSLSLAPHEARQLIDWIAGHVGTRT